MYSMKEYTAEQVREMLWKRIKDTDGAPLTQKALATTIGVSLPFLNDILNDKREPSGKVLTFLGLERIVTYRSAKRR